MNHTQELAVFENLGIVFPGAQGYLPKHWRNNSDVALDEALPRLGMDAQPSLVTQPNAAIPAILTTFIDPDILRIMTAKHKATEIFPEVKKGDWTSQTVIFPIVEATGEVSSYGDFNENGRSNVNTDFPERQAYLFQTVIEWGELELARAGLARINWAAELQLSRVRSLNTFHNFSYFYGIQGLANYGILNAPGLSAPIAPAPKAAGGVQWTVGGNPNATANEVYNDILALFTELVTQSSGNIDSELTEESPMTLSLSPARAVALKYANSFNVNVATLLKDNFPNLKIVTAIQYGAQSSQNPQGNAAGEFVQLIATEVEGQKTGFCAYNEKLRSHPIIRATSSFKQKMTAGTLGAVIRQPFAVAGMLGV